MHACITRNLQVIALYTAPTSPHTCFGRNPLALLPCSERTTSGTTRVTGACLFKDNKHSCDVRISSCAYCPLGYVVAEPGERNAIGGVANLADGDALDVTPLASPAAHVANASMPSATAAAARDNDACTEGGAGPRRGGRARTVSNYSMKYQLPITKWPRWAPSKRGAGGGSATHKEPT